MEWLEAHNGSLQVILNGLMVLIWVGYLQIFLTSFLRQHRPEILINLGAGVGLKARCFVSNLGLEPIYLLDVIVKIRDETGERTAIITDRTEMSDEDLQNPAEATNQGPLKSGALADIGSFETLIQRARTNGIDANVERSIRSIEVVVAAATSTKGSFVGAARTYAVQREEGRVHLRPVSLQARQIGSIAGRREMRRILSQRLAKAGSEDSGR